MKKILLLTATLIAFAFTIPDDSISKKERKEAVRLLKTTEKDLLSELKGLSEAQLKYKPAADRWSVEECVKHIAATELALRQMTDGVINQAANPEKRSEIKVTDEQVIQMIENREKKVQTMDKFKPENTPFKSITDALESFKGNRSNLIGYVKTTTDDLRNHVAPLPIGQLDCYQMILFIGAHSNRHTQQIREVKADAGFPKN
jgi:hypothetical protein